MATKKELGNRGEQLAVEHLREKGYQILATNWRYGRIELDVIAQHPKGTIVFVEVKTRSTDYFGYPEESVTKAKAKRIAKAAEGYLYEHQLEGNVRFDIIAITLTKEATKIYHIEDAFFVYAE